MNVNLIMDISMDQSFGVFGIVFNHFTFFGFQNLKTNVFGEKMLCIFIKLKCKCLRTGPGDLKNTKHLKFDIGKIF